MIGGLLRYSYSSARSRALASEILGPEELSEIARAPSAEIPGRIPYRGGGSVEEAEGGLHAAFLEFGRAVARSLPSSGKALIEAWLSRDEVENLKIHCRSLLFRRKAPVSLLYSASSEKIVSSKAYESRSLEELAGAMPRGPFRAVLRAGLRVPPEERLFFLESRLDLTFWGMVRDRIEDLDRLDRLSAMEILTKRADIDGWRVVGRFRDGVPGDQVLAALPPLGDLFTRKRVRSALFSGDPENLRQLFPPGGPQNPFGPQGEIFLYRRLRQTLRRVLRSTPVDISISLSSLLLKEIEIRDLRAILGAARFGTLPDQGISLLSFGGG